MRGVQVEEADIDAPWLPESAYFRVNGVDVIPYVEAELDRRFPGRADRRADDPEGLRAAWAVLQSTWAATLDRAAAMPAGTVDVSVDGEWSFAQTLRHLVLATDTWLRRGVLEIEQPFHPLGLRDAGTEGDGRRVGLHDGDPVVRRRARGPRGPRRPGGRLPRHRHRGRARRRAQEPARTRSTRRPSGRACT